MTDLHTVFEGLSVPVISGKEYVIRHYGSEVRNRWREWEEKTGFDRRSYKARTYNKEANKRCYLRQRIKRTEARIRRYQNLLASLTAELRELTPGSSSG